MKIKTNELTGAALDWAVAKCEIYPMGIWYDEDELPMIRDDEVPEYKPSIEWAQGGPIIEREGLLVRPSFTDERGKWTSILWASASFFESGPTPLIAAMRCYVASKLGDEIEIPTELGESK